MFLPPLALDPQVHSSDIPAGNRRKSWAWDFGMHQNLRRMGLWASSLGRGRLSGGRGIWGRYRCLHRSNTVSCKIWGPHSYCKSGKPLICTTQTWNMGIKNACGTLAQENNSLSLFSWWKRKSYLTNTGHVTWRWLDRWSKPLQHSSKELPSQSPEICPCFIVDGAMRHHLHLHLQHTCDPQMQRPQLATGQLLRLWAMLD